MRTVMVTGASGQLGQDLIEELDRRGLRHISFDSRDYDIADQQAVYDSVQKYYPEVIIHCAAYTDKDKAEEEVKRCALTNSMGTVNITLAAKAVDARLVYVSCADVFSGEDKLPMDINTPCCPANVYGLTKMQGEKYVAATMRKYNIVRTSCLFGIGGKNFVKTMLSQSRETKEIRVPDNVIVCPTYATDLSRTICDLISSDYYGTIHAANEGFCSLYDFACAIFRMTATDCHVIPVTVESLELEAKRLHNGRLNLSSMDKAGLPRMPGWESSLGRFLLELNEFGQDEGFGNIFRSKY